MPRRKTPIFQILSNRTGLRLENLRANKIFGSVWRVESKTLQQAKTLDKENAKVKNLQK